MAVKVRSTFFLCEFYLCTPSRRVRVARGRGGADLFSSGAVVFLGCGAAPWAWTVFAVMPSQPLREASHSKTAHTRHHTYFHRSHPPPMRASDSAAPSFRHARRRLPADGALPHTRPQCRRGQTQTLASPSAAL